MTVRIDKARHQQFSLHHLFLLERRLRTLFSNIDDGISFDAEIGILQSLETAVYGREDVGVG